MTAVTLIYFNAGGGHRAAMRALSTVLAERRSDWSVTCANLFEILDPQQQFRRLCGFEPEDYYNKRLAKGWTAGMAQELKLLQVSIRLGHGLLVERLREHWLRSEPDLVVSLIPHFNRALHDSLGAALPGVPFVTVMTDLADYPPSFWVEPGTAQHVVCGTPHAQAQALAQGCPPGQVHRVSGMILRPEFYAPPLLNRDQERARLGFDPQQPIGIVLFGGHGSEAMRTLAQQLDDVQLVLMCGHNRALAESLRRRPARAPRQIVEFTPQVRHYMQLADFFVGKPGPGSLSEAVQQGLPVITIRNAWTMPQERYNTDWVLEYGLGLVVPSHRAVGAAVRTLLQRLPEFKANVARMDNRALFEVPEVLARILERAGAPGGQGARRAAGQLAGARPD
jgi:UDP-N-acetylglucosamine:LPS N-acetylglucosamine transferase